MKLTDKEFIREIISSDFKKIENPNFTNEILEKIALSDEKKVIATRSGDILFLVPQIIYICLCVLLSLYTLIISWSDLSSNDKVLQTIDMISGLLINPGTISILIAFSLLYLLDLFLKRERG